MACEPDAQPPNGQHDAARARLQLPGGFRVAQRQRPVLARPAHVLGDHARERLVRHSLVRPWCLSDKQHCSGNCWFTLTFAKTQEEKSC